MNFRKITALGLFALALLCAGAAHADAPIQIQNAWTPATPNGADTGAVYATITNRSGANDRLVSVSSDIADEAMLHSMDMSGGTMHMAAMDDGLDIPIGRSVTLKPGDKHIMLMGLHQPIKAGDHVHLTLRFARAGVIPVDAVAKPMDGHE